MKGCLVQVQAGEHGGVENEPRCHLLLQGERTMIVACCPRASSKATSFLAEARHCTAIGLSPFVTSFPFNLKAESETTSVILDISKVAHKLPLLVDIIEKFVSSNVQNEGVLHLLRDQGLSIVVFGDQL